MVGFGGVNATGVNAAMGQKTVCAVWLNGKKMKIRWGRVTVTVAVVVPCANNFRSIWYVWGMGVMMGMGYGVWEWGCGNGVVGYVMMGRVCVCVVGE